ncbi:somatostatin receptor type 5-like [Branchiostoma floridae]|uniref:Somatostatin receptor type 5-like n=2 Tax=Branchiostoma floridae TaxID=7739 RepID=A0A9J7KFX0_BRAFL|nr:somatostatin receptor type 5-like [Branchiostoma floridae]XP_035658239.1 somatostatin receptor type 5-like [Branchiostoma floridae]
MDLNESVWFDTFPTTKTPFHGWSSERVFTSSFVNDSDTTSSNTTLPTFAFSVDNMVWSSVELVIAAIGVFANGLVVYVIARNADMRTVPNIYVLNLSVADMLYCSLFVPFLSGYVLNSRGWIFGQAMCVINKGIYAATVNASILFLTAMSFERFRAVSNPLRRRGRGSGTKRTLLTCAGLWVLAVILSLPSTIFAKVAVAYDMQHCSIWIPTGDLKTSKQATVDFIKALFMYRFVAWCVLPLFILVPTYVLLYKRIKEGMEIAVAMQARRRAENRNRVTKMVTVIVLFFFFSWSPLHVTNIIDHYGAYPYSVPVNVLSFVGMLSSANSAVNPFLYALFGQRFRLHIKRILCACVGREASWDTKMNDTFATGAGSDKTKMTHTYKRGIYLGRFSNRFNESRELDTVPTEMVLLDGSNTSNDRNNHRKVHENGKREIVFVSSV